MWVYNRIRSMSTLRNSNQSVIQTEDREIFRIQTSPIFKRISEFFAEDENFEKLYEILQLKKRGISLRAIEYSVVNRGEFEVDLNTHGRYRDILDATGKRGFDIFRRHSKFTLTKGERSVITNTAQLKFLKFAIESGLIEWIFDPNNLARVERAMAKRKQQHRRIPDEKRKIRKKQSLRAIGKGVTSVLR